MIGHPSFWGYTPQRRRKSMLFSPASTPTRTAGDQAYSPPRSRASWRSRRPLRSFTSVTRIQIPSRSLRFFGFAVPQCHPSAIFFDFRGVSRIAGGCDGHIGHVAGRLAALALPWRRRRAGCEHSSPTPSAIIANSRRGRSLLTVARNQTLIVSRPPRDAHRLNLRAVPHIRRVRFSPRAEIPPMPV
jgi:hypothetical protein